MPPYPRQSRCIGTVHPFFITLIGYCIQVSWYEQSFGPLMQGASSLAAGELYFIWASGLCLLDPKLGRQTIDLVYRESAGADDRALERGCGHSESALFLKAPTL